MNTIKYIFLIILFAGHTMAYDFDNGRGVGLGGTVLLSEPSAAGFINCPSASIEDYRYLFEAGYNRRFELSELDQVFAVAGMNLSKVSFAVGFSQFGKADYYVEQMFKAVVSYKYNNYSLSLLTSGKMLEITRADKKNRLNSAALGIGAGWRIEKYYLGLVLDNLNQPSFDPGYEGDPVFGHIFAEVEAHRLFSVTGRVTYEKGYDPGLSLGQYFHLPHGNAIYIGIQNEPIIFGGGLDIQYKGIGLNYAANYHTVLGMTHNVSISYYGSNKNKEIDGE